MFMSLQEVEQAQSDQMAEKPLLVFHWRIFYTELSGLTVYAALISLETSITK